MYIRFWRIHHTSCCSSSIWALDLVGQFAGPQRIVVFAIIGHFTLFYPLVCTFCPSKLIIARMIHLPQLKPLINPPTSDRADHPQSRGICNFRVSTRHPTHLPFGSPPRSSDGFSHQPWLLLTITTSLETTLVQTLTLTTRTMTSHNSILMLVLPNPKLRDLWKVLMTRTSRWQTNPERGLLWKSTVCSLFRHPPGLIILLESKEPVSRRASDVSFNPTLAKITRLQS